MKNCAQYDTIVGSIIQLIDLIGRKNWEFVCFDLLSTCCLHWQAVKTFLLKEENEVHLPSEIMYQFQGLVSAHT